MTIEFAVPVAIKHVEPSAEFPLGITLMPGTLKPFSKGHSIVTIDIKPCNLRPFEGHHSPGAEILSGQRSILVVVHAGKHGLDTLLADPLQAGIFSELSKADPPIAIEITFANRVRNGLGQFIRGDSAILVFVQMVEKAAPTLLLEGGRLFCGSKLFKGDFSVLITVVSLHESLSDRPPAMSLSFDSLLRPLRPWTGSTTLSIWPLRPLTHGENARSQHE